MASQQQASARGIGPQRTSAASLERAREDALSKGDLKSAARLANDLGVVYFLAGDFGKSRDFLESARRECSDVGDATGLAHALGNLARLDEKAGNTRQALALYQQAADMLHAAGELQDESATLRFVSRLYLQFGRWLEALQAYDRALLVKPRKSPFEQLLLWLYQIPLQMMGLSPS